VSYHGPTLSYHARFVEQRSKTTVNWRHHAACRDEDPELFFPIGSSGPALIQEELAKAVCFRCVVREACLEWALNTGQPDGICGGLNEMERRLSRSL
jgi:WhiB family redox-sensing transcriptional regulator